MTVQFRIEVADVGTRARAGWLDTPHGSVPTPVFMPVGTRGTVKGLTPEQVRETGARMILANTYHLALRPGAEIVHKLGGLHRFMGWDGPILTDSGGFQVFSLQSLRKVDDEGVEFKSHIDGRTLRLTPETATAIQEQLGADVAMCFDECPAAGCGLEAAELAVERTTRWARRCQEHHSRPDQALFAIVQGGLDEGLRSKSARELVELDFPGYAIGGLSVGESVEEMHRCLAWTAPLLPAHKPRYLMGVGRPEDLLEAVSHGVDMFDCVMPTRNGRNALAFTSKGRVRLRNASHQADESPLDADCSCLACRRFSRAYLRHLFMVEEMLGPILLSIHNLTFYASLMERIRHEILAGTFETYRASTLAGWTESP